MSNDKTAAALDQLNTGVTELITSDKWTDYLTTQARFHNYSANNVLLIMVQCPTATTVAGYRAWQKLDRQVRKGEKAIRILAPCTVKTNPDDPESTGRKLVGFRVASVFDVTQTDGEPLPTVTEQLDGDAPETLLDALADQIAAAGYHFTIGQVPGSANGITDPADKTVTVQAGMSPAMTAKTTAHELAHVLLHTDGDHLTEACQQDRGRAEVEAESVAYVVMAAAGIPSDGYTFGYLAGWSGGDVDKVKATAAVVQRCASKILDRLDSEQVAA